jgi:uncharacterized protein YndB with AHSA1/START domain
MLAKNGIDVAVSLPSDREIAFTCGFERPRPLLFEAWTKAEHLRCWWGCEGSTVTRCEIDLRVGGAWQMVMRMADATEHPFRGIYRDIVSNERLVYTECYDMPRFGSPEWLTTVTFEEIDRGVRVTHRILHRSREARDGHLQAGMEAGSVQTLRRLDEHVAQMAYPSNCDQASWAVKPRAIRST